MDGTRARFAQAAETQRSEPLRLCASARFHPVSYILRILHGTSPVRDQVALRLRRRRAMPVSVHFVSRRDDSGVACAFERMGTRRKFVPTSHAGKRVPPPSRVHRSRVRSETGRRPDHHALESACHLIPPRTCAADDSCPSLSPDRQSSGGFTSSSHSAARLAVSRAFFFPGSLPISSEARSPGER
jgi:hypothetical protein